jgi:hypothetical protein
MRVYYREGDEVWLGDLSFCKLSESERVLSDFDRKYWPDKFTPEMTHKPYSSFITFDDKGRNDGPRKIVHLEDATFEGICMGTITAKDTEGKTYKFYVDKPEWVQVDIKIPRWAKENKTPQELQDEDDERKAFAEMSEAFGKIRIPLNLDNE